MRNQLGRANPALPLLLIALACEGNEYAPPPAPVVTVARPEVRDVTLFAEFTGTTRAVESATVRARVKGFLQSMHFEPGTMVEAGQLLFVIDPEPFQVALESAQADVAANQAELDLRQTEFDRAFKMYKQKAASEIQYIQAKARRDKGLAALKAAEAAVHAAQLDLDYAHVEAPFAGRVGRRQVDIGNLVGAEEATVLTDIVRYSPLYVYFQLSEAELLRLQGISNQQRVAGDRALEDDDRLPLLVARANENDYPHVGHVDYTASEVDPDTGTWEVRGLLPNEGTLFEAIVPGTFVRVRVPFGEQTDALLVSERALGADQSGRFLLVVNDENVVEQRPVTLGGLYEGKRAVLSGIDADDWVIVNGLQRARPGAPVSPEREGGSGTRTAAATGSGDR